MKYLETIHERNSAMVTALITAIILLLLFIVGAPYMDPPEEYGVAVNFGTSDFGSGTVQPLKPIKSEPLDINKPTEPEVSKVVPSKAAETKEEVLTADNSEEIAIKKQKAVEAKAKAVADAKTKAEAERVAKEKQRQEEIKKKNDAMISGIKNSQGSTTGGEGNDNKAGDKGNRDGDFYAPYGGIPGTGAGGIGVGLNGRGDPTYTFYKDCSDETGFGKIVLDIVVDQNGYVKEAKPGVRGTSPNVNTECMKALAKRIALTFKFPPDPKAPTRQYGKITLNFTL